jgi:arabinose-5-phosphate isomerase|tara:strand:- start:3155 stop:4135 length:981 start_codon:yes stop_codon:yes gene_type:complete
VKNIDIKSIGRRVIKIEADAVSMIENRIDDKFELAVESILNCPGRLIISGMGKSGLIAQKIASTMASTGTPAYFVHPSEAIHGDLGMITNQDIMIILSNSGETSELIQILPALRKKNVTIIGLIGAKESTLSIQADLFLDTSVEKEACTLDLAPTASTTATLAMGDALAISLLELRGFNKENFAELHPGGILGKRLLLTIDHLIHKEQSLPFVTISTTIKKALLTISEKGLGVTGVLDEKNQMIGIITDGDIRRGIEENYKDFFDQPAKIIMSKNPKSVTSDTLAISALELMEKHSITSLFVYSNTELKKPDGIIHIHDILKLGIR